MPDDRFNEYCEDLLVRYKRRNSTTLTRRLESLCTFLSPNPPMDRDGRREDSGRG